MTAYEPVLIPGPIADEVIAEARATATVELTFGGGPLDEAEAQLLDVGVHAGVLAAFRAWQDGRLP
jgi:hypothetical protein